jgi:23S rRNA G2445 N2-methylase RlmL
MKHFCEPPSETKEWYTPEFIFKALNLTFDLDVASPGLDKTPWIPAKKAYTIVDDGLVQPWFGHCWCNPPYGSSIIKWIIKMNQHKNGIMMLYNRTDTQWFQKELVKANAICFITANHY